MNARSSVIVIGLGVIVLGFVSSCHVVPPGSRGVKVTLGRVSPKPLGEGVAFSAPFLFGDVKEVSVRQTTTEDKTEAFSSDLQTVTIAYSVMSRQPEAKVVTLYQNYAGDPYASLVAPRVREALKQVTAGYKAEEIVQKREEVREKTIKSIRTAVGELMEIADINITNIDLTDELEHAIELKMVQQQTALAKTYELDREKKQAEITLVQARAEAEGVKIKGEAIAQNPHVIDLEIAKKWNGVSPTTVVVGQGSGANPVLPLTASHGGVAAKAAGQ